ncbi:Stp1/IreP family PP2C-type Ser/Thr phosphatase [Dechloromonas sp. ZY10]|uniref:Stp1/IreP family PP2C-type Ser/Thr phosphatase n=1 Tax=Dechloromonas aquae TaxID=2664436 RepID=UPI003527EDE0
MKLADALEVVVRSDPGMIRPHNEDAVFADAALGLAVLADGMGGYNAGEIASGMATAVLANSFSRFLPTWRPGVPGFADPAVAGDYLRSEVGAANSAIYHAAQSQPQYAGMGTTLVLAWLYDNHLSVAHVGDSRLYRWRAGQLMQLTRDHSFLQEQIDSGLISAEEARHSQNRNLVTRALGVDPTVEVEVRDFPVEAGDLLLLCSDGLNDMVEDEEIALTLHALGANLPLAAEQLIQMANDNGGRDNVSVILLRIKGDFTVDRSWWQKLKGFFG